MLKKRQNTFKRSSDEQDPNKEVNKDCNKESPVSKGSDHKLPYVS